MNPHSGWMARFVLGLTCLLWSMGNALAADTPASQPGQRSARPNILLIVADDLGYADLGVQGCKDIPTPQVDSLARNGVRFTSGYVSCPVCSPTRAGLMTGRYQQRFGHEFNPGPAEQASATFGLRLNEVTLAERLKSLGYVTGMFGKWHLGYREEFRPLHRGFDEYFGFLAGAHPYLNALPQSNNPVLRGDERVSSIDYTTDAFAREAVAFIHKHHDQPFFVYLPFNAVHAPLQAAPRFAKRFAEIKDAKRRTFAAMLSAMDEAVGSVLAELRADGLEENTLIFFISDNGGPTLSTTSCNDPLRGYKGQVLEGGIRIPYMMQWKGRLPAGKVVDTPVISLDIHPTAIAAVGATLPADAQLDGVNLLPYLADAKAGIPHEQLYWRFGQQWAVRAGDWKLLNQPRVGVQLYNLARDIGEKSDLAAKEPDRVKRMQSAFDAWNAQLAKPAWKQKRPAAR